MAPATVLSRLRTRCTRRQVRADGRLENLFDRRYVLPLGSAYLGQGRTMSINGVPWGVAVAGPDVCCTRA